MMCEVFFKQNDNELFCFKFLVKEPEDFGMNVKAAINLFRKDYPDISLFDGVEIGFRKASVQIDGI